MTLQTLASNNNGPLLSASSRRTPGCRAQLSYYGEISLNFGRRLMKSQKMEIVQKKVLHIFTVFLQKFVLSDLKFTFLLSLLSPCPMFPFLLEGQLCNDVCMKDKRLILKKQHPESGN